MSGKVGISSALVREPVIARKATTRIANRTAGLPRFLRFVCANSGAVAIIVGKTLMDCFLEVCLTILGCLNFRGGGFLASPRHSLSGKGWLERQDSSFHLLDEDR